ncbi:hypothetical protein QOT17_025125 [Balamuthia mandrillaris]
MDHPNCDKAGEGTTQHYGRSGPLCGGAIAQASCTPSSTTTTTLPTDRLDALEQALSQLHASQADHDKLLVKQASDASSLSNHINHLDQKWETFADLLSNDIKEDRKRTMQLLQPLMTQSLNYKIY